MNTSGACACKKQRGAVHIAAFSDLILIAAAAQQNCLP